MDGDGEQSARYWHVSQLPKHPLTPPIPPLPLPSAVLDIIPKDPRFRIFYNHLGSAENIQLF